MPLAPLRGSQPTGGIGGRGVGVGAGVDTDPAEAAVENDVEVVAATGVEAGGPPAEYARICQSMPEYAIVCQSMPELSEYARVWINFSWTRHMIRLRFRSFSRSLFSLDVEFFSQV